MKDFIQKCMWLCLIPGPCKYSRSSELNSTVSKRKKKSQKRSGREVLFLDCWHWEMWFMRPGGFIQPHFYTIVMIIWARFLTFFFSSLPQRWKGRCPCDRAETS